MLYRNSNILWRKEGGLKKGCTQWGETEYPTSVVYWLSGASALPGKQEVVDRIPEERHRDTVSNPRPEMKPLLNIGQKTCYLSL